MLTIEQAKHELEIAARNNPGPWEQHSVSAVDNAMRIAEKAGMDPEKAWVMGLLHDIGRRYGVTGMRHGYDGYRYLLEIGQPEIAPVCLSHSYPIKDADMFCGKHDCTEEEKAAGDISASEWNCLISFSVVPISPQREANTTGTVPTSGKRPSKRSDAPGLNALHATCIAARSTCDRRRRAIIGMNETSGLGFSSVDLQSTFLRTRTFNGPLP